MNQAYNLFIGLVTKDGHNLLDNQTIYDVYGRIGEILAQYQIDGATFTQTEGIWKGQFEPSIIVSISPSHPTHVEQLARDLARHFDQECVAYQVTNRLTFVSDDPAEEAPAVDKPLTLKITSYNAFTLEQIRRVLRNGVNFNEITGPFTAQHYTGATELYNQ